MRKKIYILLLIFSINSLIGCGSKNKEIYGTYTFDSPIYISSLSSTSIENIKEQNKQTKYRITQDVFEIISTDNKYKISNPKYDKKEMDESLIKEFNTAVFNAVSISEYKEKYKYTIYNEKNQKIKYYLYLMDSEIWIASYINNNVSNTDIIYDIYKIKK